MLDELSADIYVFTREGVRAVDRAAMEEFGIPGVVLMENASRELLDEVLDMLEETIDDEEPRVVIVCGRGNNGGDGWALARHLDNFGFEPAVVSLGEPRAGSDAHVNRMICEKMGIEELGVGEAAEQLAAATLIVDAMFGTGLDRAVEGEAAGLIEQINASGVPVLAVDIPSGLDCETGQALGPTIRANRTVTFVGLKRGFTNIDAQPYVGEVSVGDIGVPFELLLRHGEPLEMPPEDDRREVDAGGEASPRR